MVQSVSDPESRLRRAVAAIEAHYAHRLIATALFGSRVGRRARADSDWDLLLVLHPDESLRRSLYREWDDEVAESLEAILPGISPHFVHLPMKGAEPSSLWLEVAIGHRILSDRTGALAAHLGRVRASIDAGHFERRSVHGMPYWRTAT